jgi:hypothetical protein
MQLASLLPGLRDLRSPLAGGALWLLFIWLLVHGWVGDTATLLSYWPLAPLAEVFKEAGPVGLSLAIGFAAYLLGAVLVEPVVTLTTRTILNSAVRKVECLPHRTILRKSSLLGWLGLASAVSSCEEQTKLYYSSLLAKIAVGAPDMPRPPEVLHENLVSVSPRDDAWRTLRGMKAKDATHPDTAEAFVAITVWKQLDRTADRLLVGAPSLYDIVDRIKGEAEFRFAITLPLSALVALMAYRLSPVWWSALILTSWLVIAGIRMMGAYARRIIDGWATGVVTPPAIERIEQEVEQTISRIRALRARPANAAEQPLQP